MTTFLEMQDEALDLAGLSSPEERGRVKRFLNEDYLKLAAKIGTPIKSTATITLTQGQGDYDLTATPFSLTDFVRVQTLIYSWGGLSSNMTDTLWPVAPQEVFRLRRNPIAGVVRVYAINGASVLMLYPAPTTGDTLILSYEYRPAQMASDSDTPVLIRYEDEPAVVYAAAYRAALLAKAPAQVVQFLLAEKTQRANDAIAAQNRIAGTAKSIRRTGRRFIPHDNSMDLGGRW